MSNTTLHPASQNLWVEIRDASASPGTMCASVICTGSHGMSRLHVWVDWITLPFGNVIVIGCAEICLFITGAPLTKKWPVAPEYEMACLTARTRRCELKMVADCCSCCRLFSWTIVVHFDLRVELVLLVANEMVIVLRECCGISCCVRMIVR